MHSLFMSSQVNSCVHMLKALEEDIRREKQNKEKKKKRKLWGLGFQMIKDYRS